MLLKQPSALTWIILYLKPLDGSEKRKMGRIRWRGKTVFFDHKGFITSKAPLKKAAVSRKRSIRSVNKIHVRTMPKVQRRGFTTPSFSPAFKIEGEARDFFRKTRKMDRAEKAEDLLETAKTVYPATPDGFRKWKRDPKRTDLRGVDTRDIEKATAFFMDVPSKAVRESAGIVEPLDILKRGDGDVFSFRAKDKDLKSALRDEIEPIGGFY